MPSISPRWCRISSWRRRSPLFANHGIPANGSVIQQIIPTFYVNRLQQQFSGHFSSLQIALTEVDPPVYDISVITNSLENSGEGVCMSDLPVIYDITGPVAKTAEELRQQVIETATRLSPDHDRFTGFID